MTSEAPNYRPDIDGLRGWAVAFVILFHLDIATFGGGYTGVDVFFVISGFLITRNITNDHSAKRFSFSRFYVRRARRLFPALFFTLLCSFLAGAILFAPEHFAKLGQSTVSVLLFGSNIYFWLNSGYFDLTAAEQPLLHTWSLSVEEQFYFIWPVLLALALRSGREQRALQLLLAIGIGGVVCTEVMLGVSPQAAFYLMPFRIFELAAGAAMVWLVDRRPKDARVHELLVVVGVVLVLYPVFAYTNTTPFPGTNALPTVVGTALLIYSGSAQYAGRILNNPLAVGIGLVSYSLYLVHWPIIVFYRYWKFDDLGVEDQVGIVVASLSLAVFMYYWVEMPFRRRQKRSINDTNADEQRLPSSRHFVITCFVLASCLAGVSGHAYQTGGWTWRLPTEIQKVMAQISDPDASLEQRRAEEQVIDRASTCMFLQHTSNVVNLLEGNGCLDVTPERENYLLFGDSVAAHYYYGLSTVFPGKHFLQATIATCVPSTQEQDDAFGDCAELSTYLFSDYLPRHTEIDGVILSAQWKKWHLEPLAKTVDYLKSIGHRAIVFGPSVEYKSRVPSLIARHGRLAGLESFVQGFELQGRTKIDDQLKQMANDKNFEYVSLFDVACPKGCPVFHDGAPIIRDQLHFTKEGSQYYVRQIEQETNIFE